MDKILKATHSGTVTIGDNELSCAVLEDGTRILTQGAVFKAFGRPRKGKSLVDPRNVNMPSFVDAKNLKPFADKVFSIGTNFEVVYMGSTGRTLTGYRADILPLICEVYLMARDAGVLSEKQRAMSTASDILMRSLARIGIVALIDEATGYQYDRERDELQKLLQMYVSEELLPWRKTFPDIYYRELFRFNGWDFTVQGIKKRPGCVGTWTNKLIYEQLPPGILDELKKKTPKSTSGNRTRRYFQLLTEDIGSPHLKEQINQVITVFQLSDNMKHMWSQFETLKLRQMGQMELPFAFDEKGHTIAPIEESALSEHNKNLKKALNYKEATPN